MRELLWFWVPWKDRHLNLSLERVSGDFLFGNRESGEEQWKNVEMSEEAAAISFSEEEGIESPALGSSHMYVFVFRWRNIVIFILVLQVSSTYSAQVVTLYNATSNYLALMEVPIT